MDKRVGHGLLGRDQKSPTDRGVVDFSDARVRIRSRAKPSHESLMRELDEIRSLLDQGLSTEAKDRLALLISNARHDPTILALARCALSTALEQQGHYRDSLAAVAMYEDSDSRAKLDDQTVSYLRVQIGLAYNYNGDHPKAITMLYFHDHEEGLIWIEDLGETDLFSFREESWLVRGALYRSALDEIAKLHELPQSEWSKLDGEMPP